MTMRPIKFEEIVPMPSSFYLEKTKKTYHLKPCVIADSEWMRTKYGDSITERFRNIDLDFVSTVAMRLMADDDKEDFARRVVKTIDEESGARGTMEIGGSQLLKHLISGPKEVLGIIDALLRTIGLSQPLVDELGKHALEDLAKKKATLTSAGAGSSKGSRSTTVGPRAKSSRASRSGKRSA